MNGEVIYAKFIAGPVVELRVRVKLSNPAPGRFVHIAVPGFSLRRPISLCGYENGVARLVFAVKGGGTAALAEAKEGDKLDILGALGNGFPEAGGRVLLLGGGIGLPPLLYYSKVFENTHTVAGFRNSESVILAQEFPSIDICTDDGSAGFDMYPHERLKMLLAEGQSFERVLACGPHPLLKAAAAVCAEFSLPCFVSMEERMGCGVGACMVCACAVGDGYKRVCKDGPVFAACDVFPAEVLS